MREKYFECQNCGQAVQGFNAMQQIDCCERPDFVEIHGPRDEIPESAQQTKWGDYQK